VTCAVSSTPSRSQDWLPCPLGKKIKSLILLLIKPFIQGSSRGRELFLYSCVMLIYRRALFIMLDSLQNEEPEIR